MTRHPISPQPYAVNRKDTTDDQQKSNLAGSEIEKPQQKKAVEKRTRKSR